MAGIYLHDQRACHCAGAHDALQPAAEEAVRRGGTGREEASHVLRVLVKGLVIALLGALRTQARGNRESDA